MNQLSKKDTTENPNLMYILEHSRLRKGDIILSKSKDKTSKKIRVLTLGKYSHACLFLGNYAYVEAGGPGTRVTTSDTQRLLFASPEDCCVLRLRDNVPESKLNEIVEYGKALIGTEYSLDEARRVPFRLNQNASEENRQFCSRLVAQAYQYAGFKITSNPDYCTPGGISMSKLLIEVPNCIRAVSPDEIQRSETEGKSLLAMDMANDSLLSSVSEICGEDIQNHIQLIVFICKNPLFDEKFAHAIIESGYLKLDEIQEIEKPYLYDFEALLKFFDYDSIKEIGEEGLSQERDVVFQSEGMIKLLDEPHAHRPLETLRLLIDLHHKILDFSSRRQAVWHKCLEFEKS